MAILWKKSNFVLCSNAKNNMQNTEHFDLAQIPQLSAIDRAYASAEANLRDFYAHEVNYAAFEQIIATKSAHFSAENRAELVAVLTAQYAKLADDMPHKSLVINNIAKLGNAKTFAITTAHQPSVATGVLYYVYKILAAVRLCAELKTRYPKYDFVPIYWLGGEDHDFDEISSINIFNKSLVWEKGEKGGAVGRMSTDSLRDFLAELQPILGDSEKAKEVFDLLHSAYTAQDTFADATRQLLLSFFGSRGLVMLDGDDKQLKQLFIPAMQNDLFQHDSHRLVSATVEAMAQRGYNNQAFVREINLFYFLPNARERIVFDEETGLYLVLNTDLSFTPKGILQELLTKPELFSPNVILRPLYQETVLPNLAYIGGGGEIAYWLERRAQFDYFDVPMPMLVRRPSLLLLDVPTQQRLEKLKLSFTDLLPHYDIIAKNYLLAQSPDSVDCEVEREKVMQVFADLQQRVLTFDKDLTTFVAAQQTQVDNIFGKIAEKLTRSAKKREETNLQQIQKLKEKLFPKNGLQERVENILPFYLSHGSDIFDHIAEAIADPLAQEFIVVRLS
jgi:bacillithiol synthase